MITKKWHRYPAYKDSGVEWLGAIPEHWEVKRLKYVCYINPSKSPISNLSLDTEISFVPMEYVDNYGNIDLRETKTLKEVSQGYTYFQNKDVIIAKITPCFENGKGALCSNLHNTIGFGSTEFHVIRVILNKTIPEFTYYLTKSTRFTNLGSSELYGVAGQKRVPESFLSNYVTGIPPLPEQQKIAEFLDEETSKIDKLIAKKTRLIELLKEKRTALISHAVTKGLNPDVPMKDSGVEWLGEVPESWNVLLLKRIANIRYGLGQPPPEILYGTPLIRATNVKSGRIFQKDMIYIDPKQVPESRNAVLAAGEIIVVRSGAYTGDSALIPEEYHGSIAGYDMVTTVKEGSNQFIAWQLLSSEVRHIQFAFHQLRAAQPHLNAEELRGTIITFPPLPEQQKIAEFLDQETAKIDTLITKTRTSIDYLKEYRTALISAAVTGKIDVREEV